MPRAIILSCALAALAPAAASAQPSFDCDDARTATERAICASSGLASLELRMTEVYDDLADRIGETKARSIADRQLERRQACDGDTACIERQLLTSIGIFRAEARAASANSPEAGDAALRDLRTALGQAPAATPDTGGGNDDSRAEKRAQGAAEAFARLPEYRRRNVQGRLRDAGFLSGAVDGIWGADSAAAVRSLLAAARKGGRNFPVQNEAGADALYRFIDSDPFYYEFIPKSAR
ncbi:hypothetical protein [Limimaricola hongkongensis]|uniref:Lysozyme inhibitor LprI N-terminal domain-containing protein n=1 Tax=Limimaricola hongkongensis DSM 17492 TaxID=1122180 RepID=A0A017H9C9_9RHOB|nr:hypothetical protein [Limimaricola hongkongensis]EYD70399.1 hypothetical protein Lokhon_00153 [Limimaricola hongkongensis DSM 17492]